MLVAIAAGVSLVGCSAKETLPGADAAGRDAAAGATGDAAARGRDASSDAARETGARDAAGTDAAGCGAPMPQASPTASTTCAATAATIDPASLCAGAATCPVSTFYRLTSASGPNAHPWDPSPTIAVVGTAGASVLAQSTSSPPLSCLFSMTAGAASQVQEVSSLSVGAVLTAAGGARTMMTGQAGGLGYLQETASGWVGDAVPSLSGSISLTAAIGAPSGDLYALYGGNQNGPASGPWGLARRHAGCWQLANLPSYAGGPSPIDAGVDAGVLPPSSDPAITFTSIGLDAAGRPWTVGIYNELFTGLALEVVGPDGIAFSAAAPNLTRTPPIVLGGGLSGSDAYPTLIVQAVDGIHLLEAAGPTATWTDRTLAQGSTKGSDTCPHTEFTQPAAGCPSVVTCSHSHDGPTSGLAAARTSSGKTFLARPETKGGLTTYSLTCSQFSPNQCACTSQEVTSSQGSGVIVIVRADAAPPAEVLRLSFPTTVEVDSYNLAMVARGDTLLLVANQAFVSGASSEMLYFEIDTSGL